MKAAVFGGGRVATASGHAVPLGYGQLTSPLDQIASVAGGRAGTNFSHIPDGTVSIR
jgi:hypothetical protein